MPGSTCRSSSLPISETRSVNADARIDISNIKGDVTVSGWDKNEVSITGTLGDGAKKLAIDGSGSSLTIKVEPPDKQGWFNWGSESRMGNTSLDLKVPRNAEIKIEVVSADVALTGREPITRRMTIAWYADGTTWRWIASKDIKKGLRVGQC